MKKPSVPEDFHVLLIHTLLLGLFIATPQHLAWELAVCRLIAFGNILTVKETLQCPNFQDAKYLYDQLVVLAPLMVIKIYKITANFNKLALSAATPIVRGYLVDTDVRWFIISDSVDDRTPQERCEGCEFVPKSRFSSVDMFLTAPSELEEVLNDIPFQVHAASLTHLKSAGVNSFFRCYNLQEFHAK